MHGSILNVTINGITFIPTADCDANVTPNEWENTVEPNGSGPGSIMSVKRVPGVENLTLRVNSTETGFLRTWADSAEMVEYFHTERDGSVWGCRGLLQLDPRSTAKGTMNIKIQCETSWDIAAA